MLALDPNGAAARQMQQDAMEKSGMVQSALQCYAALITGAGLDGADFAYMAALAYAASAAFLAETHKQLEAFDKAKESK